MSCCWGRCCSRRSTPWSSADPVRALLLRDTASFAHGWAGKLLVAAVLVAVPVAMVLTSVGGGRYGRYADDSWKALLMLVVLAGSYAASRRLVLTVLIGAVTVAVVSWVLSPDLAVTRNGDPTVLAHLDQQARQGWLASNHAVAVAEIDLEAAQPVRLAGIGADDTTPMEVGSMTKAMTGLVIADAVAAERSAWMPRSPPTFRSWRAHRPAPPRCRSSSPTPPGTPSSVPQPSAAPPGWRRSARTSSPPTAPR